MDEKDKKIAELESQIASLKSQLLSAHTTISNLQGQLKRQYRANSDYLPYPEEDEYR